MSSESQPHMSSYQSTPLLPWPLKCRSQNTSCSWPHLFFCFMFAVFIVLIWEFDTCGIWIPFSPLGKNNNKQARKTKKTTTTTTTTTTTIQKTRRELHEIHMLSEKVVCLMLSLQTAVDYGVTIQGVSQLVTRHLASCVWNWRRVVLWLSEGVFWPLLGTPEYSVQLLSCCLSLPMVSRTSQFRHYRVQFDPTPTPREFNTIMQ